MSHETFVMLFLPADFDALFAHAQIQGAIFSGGDIQAKIDFERVQDNQPQAYIYTGHYNYNQQERPFGLGGGSGGFGPETLGSARRRFAGSDIRYVR
jgi:hypothetical protein